MNLTFFPKYNLNQVFFFSFLVMKFIVDILIFLQIVAVLSESPA